MFARLLLAVLVILGGALAFAPAPLPKRERGGPEKLTLERIQGTWVVQKVERSSNKGYQVTSDPLTEVKIEGSRWSFINGRGAAPYALGLKVDGTKAPAWFDLGDANAPQTSGIIRLRNGELQVLYQWGMARPQSFEVPPDGYWCITFRRR